MRLKLLICVCTICLVSCDGWETKKINADEILKEKWQSIGLNDVDTYPQFTTCEHHIEKELQLDCFQNVIVNAIQRQFSKQLLVVQEPLEDTIWVHLVIDEKGVFCVDSLQFTPQIIDIAPALPRWLNEGVQSLPKAEAAIKRSVPVKTKFKLPIVFKVD